MFDSDSFDVSAFSESSFSFAALVAGLSSVLLQIACGFNKTNNLKKKK